MSLRLEDIELISRVKYAYFRGIDTCDTGLLDRLFTDDAGIDYEGGSYHWQIEGRPAIVAALKDSFNATMIGCHTAHHPEIDFESDTAATGTWYMTDIAIHFERDHYLTGSALYRDRYRKTDAGWKIARTTYRRLYEMIEPLSAKQAKFTAHYLKTMAR